MFEKCFIHVLKVTKWETEHCSSKKTGKGKRPGKGGNRFWKSIGLGFKTPREATEGLINYMLKLTLQICLAHSYVAYGSIIRKP